MSSVVKGSEANAMPFRAWNTVFATRTYEAIAIRLVYAPVSVPGDDF